MNLFTSYLKVQPMNVIRKYAPLYKTYSQLKTRWGLVQKLCGGMLIKHCFAVLLLFSPIPLSAQPHFANDTLAFRKYFSKAPFPETNMALIQALWVELKPKTSLAGGHNVHYVNGLRPQRDVEYNPGPVLTSNGSSHSRSYDDEDSYRYVTHSLWEKTSESLRFKRMLKQDLHDLQDSILNSGMNVDSIKEDMVNRLEAFDKAAYYKPIFYADIHSTYKGDYRKYVDDLFKKSLITSPKRLRRFTAYARKNMLLKDRGFQFTLCLALYELWIKQVKEGFRVLTDE